MFGNWAGGRIADQSPKRETLGTCLFLAGLFALLTLILVAVLSHPWDESATAFYLRWPAKAVNFINDSTESLIDGGIAVSPHAE